jgi:hypothetical protein
MEMDTAAATAAERDAFIHMAVAEVLGRERQAVGGGRKAARACHVRVCACMEDEEEVQPAGDAPATGWW